MSAPLSNSLAMATRTDRRVLLLDEARSLIAGGGLAAVTHRSVEKAAGVPHGSVTYYFGSRDGLVLALVDALADECEAMVSEIAEQTAAGFAGGGRPDLDVIADGIAAWIDDHVEMHLCRLELELAAARDPRLRGRMADAARVFWRMCEPLAAATGSTDPERDGRGMATMVDGLLLDRLARPDQSHELLVEALRRILSPVG
jgi:AcrR family transcriptional regulator